MFNMHCTYTFRICFTMSLVCTFVGTFDLIIYTDKNAHVPKKCSATSSCMHSIAS